MFKVMSTRLQQWYKLSLPSYTDSALKRELNFCNVYLSLLYFGLWCIVMLETWKTNKAPKSLFWPIFANFDLCQDDQFEGFPSNFRKTTIIWQFCSDFVLWTGMLLPQKFGSLCFKTLPILGHLQNLLLPLYFWGDNNVSLRLPIRI